MLRTDDRAEAIANIALEMQNAIGLLKDHYNLQRRGEIALKGKGKMLIYWFLGKKRVE